MGAIRRADVRSGISNRLPRHKRLSR
jgi:hypothetical protein